MGAGERLGAPGRARPRAELLRYWRRITRYLQDLQPGLSRREAKRRALGAVRVRWLHTRGPRHRERRVPDRWH